MRSFVALHRIGDQVAQVAASAPAHGARRRQIRRGFAAVSIRSALPIRCMGRGAAILRDVGRGCAKCNSISQLGNGRQTRAADRG